MPVFFVVCILVVISTLCKGHFQPCRVFPTDLFVEVGSSVRLVCNCDSVRNGKFFWTLNRRRLDENLSKTINSTHSVLSLRNFTHSNATVECHNTETTQILGGTIVKTYSKPKNIECLLHYENPLDDGVPQLFTCTWEHQTHNLKKINYTVNIESAEVFWCSSTVKSCTIQDVDVSGQISLVKNIIVTVKAETAKWTSSSDPYKVSPLSILKMNPPLVAVTASPDHLLVSWKIILDFLDIFFCQIKYYKTFSTTEETPKITNCTSCRNATLEDVESCTFYNISVRCSLKNSTWSDWSQEETILTKVKKRHVELLLWRKVSELQEHRRKVHLMWRLSQGNVSLKCADTVKFTIRQTTYGENMTEGKDTTCVSSLCDVEVDENAHQIHLRALQSESVIAQDSIYVPAVAESLPRVSDIRTSNHEGVILVSWRAPKQPVRSYVIDWTHNGNQYEWAESENTDATLSDLHDRKPYNITVTPLLLDGRTGHSTQALQICSGFGAPGRITVRDVEPYDTSAFVSWDTTSEDVCSGAVLNYTVFYRNQSTGTLHGVTVNGGKLNVSLKDLTPATQYSIYVEGRAENGLTISERSFFTTKRFDPRLLNSIIACGIIIFILVIICVVMWKKVNEKPVPDPAVSSVAEWLLQSNQKDKSHFQKFFVPFESYCDQIYIQEFLSTLTPSGNGDPWMNQGQESLKTTISLMPNAIGEKPVALSETQLSPFPEESTSSLSTESSSVNPYRSQATTETLVPRKTNQCKLESNLPHERFSPKSVYVSLHMYEQNDWLK
ncbi:interleukin-6 receptor subunit beta isoform X1 [Oryzias melastigma]|uniref:Interleukin-6 receptor subunit beta-like n=1 Tax=Oryzias melastigma TaxID=30732 RepID=A0A3B3DZC2_ORYME|nr:interleukin-6 receptor subunit beta isoform X1 [Oryzias melastigma]